VLKFRLVFNPANNSFQNIDVNLTSLSKITILWIPCNLNISFINISMMLIDLLEDFRGIKCVDLLILSITTIIESLCILVLGKLVIKSSEIVSHFHSGIGRGYSRSAGC